MDENKIPYNRDVTYFARTNFRSSNEIFGIKRKDRRQHVYVLGKSGSGKSVLLSNMIVQDIKNGQGVCVVDPHGELVEDILNLIPKERAKDVIYFNPADTDFNIGFNVIQLDNPKYKHLVASGLMGIFTKIWANVWSARMEYILNNTILALLDTPNTTMLGIPRMLVDKDYRQMIINNLKDPVVKAFWIHEYEQWREQFRNEAIAPIQNKVGQFLSTSIIRNVVGQPKSTIDIFKIMNEGKIFLVNVSKGRIGEDNSALLGGMIITKIQLATMERVRIPECDRNDFYLYVDEFQNFATDSFSNILSEARKYRLNLTIAHQYTAQLENEGNSKVRDAVFGNVGTMLIFRVGADDASFLEKEFEPEFTTQDLVNLPNYNIYLKLMIDGVTSRPFSATTLPPLKVDLSLGVKEKIIESSRRLYTRPRQEVEDEITKWSGTLQTSDGESKYKADCSNCSKMTMVPFEPKKGRPIYCKECLYKIKTGSLKPDTGFTITSSSSKVSEKDSSGPLAILGIEFNKNSNSNTKDDSFNFKKKKKQFKSSPFLKGLLKKIGTDKDKPIKENNNKDEKLKLLKSKIKSISLSSLSKSKNNKFKSKKIPTKEATEERKESLRNLLTKINEKNKEKIKIPKKETKISAPQLKEPLPTVEVVEEKKEIITEIKKIPPKSEIKKETITIEPILEEKKEEYIVKKEKINIPTTENEINENLNNKNKEEKNQNLNLSNKKNFGKEVPEDVLRKILE